MAKFLKSVLHAGRTYHSPDREVPVTRERLKHWADGFKKITAAKYNVPIDWDHGSTLDGVVPVKMSEQKKRRSAKNTVGELANFELAPDGNSAILTLEVSDPQAAGRADRNEVYISPVILDKWRDGHGTEYSDVITHVDFVNHPVDHSQGPFIKASEPGTVALAIRMGLDAQVCRLAFGDDEEEEKDGDGDGVAGEGEGSTLSDNEASETSLAPGEQPENKDMPADDSGAMKAEAIVAHFSQIGIELPADWSFKSTAAEDILLAALKTFSSAQQKAEAEESPEEGGEGSNPGDVTVADPGYAALSLHANNQHRESLKTKINSLLKDGRCTPHEAEREVAKLGTIKLSLGADGKQLDRSDVEKFIESREAVPRGTFWTDQQKTAMSTVVEPQATFMATPAWAGSGLSDEDAAKTAAWALGQREKAVAK